MAGCTPGLACSNDCPGGVHQRVGVLWGLFDIKMGRREAPWTARSCAGYSRPGLPSGAIQGIMGGNRNRGPEMKGDEKG